MTSRTDDQRRLPGTLITVDGPGGVGKSSAVTRAVDLLTAAGLPVHGTRQPSRAELGELARHGTDTYHGMSLACLCAADRHHQLDTEIKPALREGRIVLCDRYVASSLMLQGLDGLPSRIVWQLNHGVYRPDLSLILTGDPAVISARLRARGGHSRFERVVDNSDRESALYTRAVAELHSKGWPVQTVDRQCRRHRCQHRVPYPPHPRREEPDMSLSLITVNVGAPPVERARRQLEWLAARPEDIFVLTETKATLGSQLLAEGCTAANYSVTFPKHDPGELGVMIVSRVATNPDPLTGALSYLPARATGIIVNTSDGPLRVLGAYVPSRDATLERTERKKRWIEGFHTALDATKSSVPVLLLGDLNVLEPSHQPEHRQQFAPFEYDFYRALTDRHGLIDVFRHLHPCRIEHSWARRPDLGYRYDHAHSSAQLLPLLQGCEYVHQTRDVLADGSRLTDHSGLAVRLATTATTPLLTSDPAAAATSENEPEPTLF